MAWCSIGIVLSCIFLHQKVLDFLLLKFKRHFIQWPSFCRFWQDPYLRHKSKLISNFFPLRSSFIIVTLARQVREINSLLPSVCFQFSSEEFCFVFSWNLFLQLIPNSSGTSPVSSPSVTRSCLYCTLSMFLSFYISHFQEFQKSKKSLKFWTLQQEQGCRC